MYKDELTPSERMRKLVMREEIDRIPVMGSGSEFGASLSNLSLKEFYLNPEWAMEVGEKVVELLGLDSGPSYGMPQGSCWDFGGEVELKTSPRLSFPIVKKRPVEKVEDIDNLTIPDIEKAPHMGRTVKFQELNMKKGRDVSFTVGSPMGVTVDILGATTMLKWFRKEPEAIYRIQRIATDYILKRADYFIDRFGVENCSVVSMYPMESNALIPTSLFEKFSLPYISEIHSKLIDKGIKKWSVHLCGDHMKNLYYWKNEIKLAPRTTFSLSADMDIVETGKYLGPDYIIGGNVPTTILKIGTYNEVLNYCEDIIKKMKNRPGGFILMPDCAISPSTPPLNMYAMVNAAKTYGRY
ncbi:uroporphyrinogen decarboxylase HemE [Gottschalkia purinilytica]|uniref:Uroporphyrinogen decarboxylase HemE n=1 Tax=Gottschalkia purinilytica TaxID=1503 RepID=A0A0L0W8V8_GOTPU|nr:uroporphyrinogen decarboxylase family protein [Gottschalkia purinilytica]KNF07973.1 uroporphyrinogen decarboxylase HemE [Gottschalkia purinilytica]